MLQATKTNGIWKYVGCIVLLSTVLSIALYKPLPDGFCKTKMDRFIMHIVEPALRVAYYYPSRMFSKPSSMVWWTRLALNHLSSTLGLTVSTSDTIRTFWRTWNGVGVKVYQPIDNQTATNGAVIFIHGGGFALGSVEMYDSLLRRMSADMKTLFISIEYRLVPETVYPGNIHDCENAVNYFFANAEREFGIDTTKVVIMGDSAGGNMATVIAQRRNEEGAVPKLAGQVLIYPLLQMADMQSISYRYFETHLDGYALVDPESVAYYYMFYAGINMDEKAYLVKNVLSNGHVAKKLRKEIDELTGYGAVLENSRNYNNASIAPRKFVSENYEAQELLEKFMMDPSFSPLMRKDLSGMPESLVITCEFDILRDEGLIYANRLEKDNVSTTTINYENGFHAMLNFHSELYEASKAVYDIEQWTLNVINS
ncbi:unnamed protein product [Caenorhabditis angaria]|uniref:Alpha/beta hydrolase fold-3 domain-containing protein n=1 Tax=Caenorhabditis angaria TaxID=860376 RepID=A0A9P1N9N3_9PELO|nr:unnamed protein product [Caenorhabditis angaria]